MVAGALMVTVLPDAAENATVQAVAAVMSISAVVAPVDVQSPEKVTVSLGVTGIAVKTTVLVPDSTQGLFAAEQEAVKVPLLVTVDEVPPPVSVTVTTAAPTGIKSAWQS
jgi:hypothetical protein